MVDVVNSKVPQKAFFVNNDGLITIATGRSCTEKDWKNKELAWSALVAQLSTTTRTRETFDQYTKMTRPQRDAAKDVGGFVGGSLKGGKRNADSVAWRSLITLDADHISGTAQDFIGQIRMLFGHSCIIYSTHSHNPKSPRLRVVIPLGHPITPDEYQAISRRIAADINIDAFCEVSFRPHQLMYWPSTSSDGEFITEIIDTPWANPDEILARYPDWKDSSYWPEPSSAHEARKKTAAVQGDPLTKPGLIGAFCRTYSIQDAIAKFIPDVYSPGKTEDRWTYTAGSTTGGLVLYEDKFAYSHHGTDPIGGNLVNAFDLIRIHKFGKLDEDVAPGMPSSELPSYDAMKDFAAADDSVKLTLHEDRIAAAEADFVAEDDPEWAAKLGIDRRGKVLSTAANVILILQHDPKLKGRIAFDEFAYSPVVKSDLPWRAKNRNSQWSDFDDSELRNYLSANYDIKGANIITDAFNAILNRNSFHPVRDYFKSLEWDGQPRVDTLLIDYFGADDIPYSRAVIRKTLCAAVARIYEPGIKFDYMLVLVGSQGIGKSSFWSILCRNRWFNDSLTFNDMHGREAPEKLQETLINEIAEMSGMKKQDLETIKAFISRQKDKYRAAYGRRAIEYPRQGIIIGTTNHGEFLRDLTGNRRFWPVVLNQSRRTKSLWRDLTSDEVDQIWAETVHFYSLGEELFLTGEEFETAVIEQRRALEGDDREGPIREYLDRLLPENWNEMDLGARRSFLQNDFGESAGTVRRDRVCVLEIWTECFGRSPIDLKPAESTGLYRALQKMSDWKRYDQNKDGKLWFKNYGSQRAFVRNDIAECDTDAV